MPKAFITITYCPKCGWLLRSAYMAQELLTTFVDHLEGVTLKPSQSSGVFAIYLADELLWDRKREGRFPEIKELKKLVRDSVAPALDLGHTEKP